MRTLPPISSPNMLTQRCSHFLYPVFRPVQILDNSSVSTTLTISEPDGSIRFTSDWSSLLDAHNSLVKYLDWYPGDETYRNSTRKANDWPINIISRWDAARGNRHKSVIAQLMYWLDSIVGGWGGGWWICMLLQIQTYAQSSTK